MKLLRKREVCERTARCPSSLYGDIAAGLFPPPAKWSRSSVWPDFEVDQIIQARMAGRSDDELRAIVKELVAARKMAA